MNAARYRGPAALLFILGLMLGGCSETPVGAAGNANATAPQAVVVEETLAWTNASRRSFAGTAQAGVQTPLSFRVEGEITRLPVSAGQRVQAGSVVAVLDATDYRLQRQQRSADLAQAKAGLDQARTSYFRVRSLYEAGNVSTQELDDAKAAFETAQAQVQKAEKAVALAQKRVGYCRLEAPIAAEVLRIPVEIHQNVAAGHPVVVLANQGPLEVELGVPESFLPRLHRGDKASVRFDAQPESVYSATVTEIGIQAGPTTAFPVTVRLDQPAPGLRSGMAASVTFTASLKRPYIAVPPQAVRGQQNQPTIFVYHRDTEQVEKRPVVTGELVAAGLQVFKGVSPGETIVTRGVHRLRDGVAVRPLSQ